MFQERGHQGDGIVRVNEGERVIQDVNHAQVLKAAIHVLDQRCLRDRAHLPRFLEDRNLGDGVPLHDMDEVVYPFLGRGSHQALAHDLLAGFGFLVFLENGNDCIDRGEAGIDFFPLDLGDVGLGDPRQAGKLGLRNLVLFTEFFEEGTGNLVHNCQLYNGRKDI